MLTRQEMDLASCANSSCDHEHDEELVLVPQCHPEVGVVLSYRRQTGNLVVECWQCEKQIAVIQVAKMPER